MFKTNIIKTKDDTLDDIVEIVRKIMKEKNMALVTGVVGEAKISAPTKRKDYYEDKRDILYAPDLFKNPKTGVDTITRGGYIILSFLPEDEINPKLLVEETN